MRLNSERLGAMKCVCTHALLLLCTGIKEEVLVPGCLSPDDHKLQLPDPRRISPTSPNWLEVLVPLNRGGFRAGLGKRCLSLSFKGSFVPRGQNRIISNEHLAIVIQKWNVTW